MQMKSIKKYEHVVYCSSGKQWVKEKFRDLSYFWIMNQLCWNPIAFGSVLSYFSVRYVLKCHPCQEKHSVCTLRNYALKSLTSLTQYIPPSQFKIHSQSVSNAVPAIDSSCSTIFTICEELSVNIVPREACFTFQLLHLCSQQTWYTEKKLEKPDSACREHNSSWIFRH